MTDPILEHGLGSLHSPSDPRDYTIDALYAATGIDAATVIPATYRVPAPWPPILNQGTSPKCVAYGTETLKRYQDIRDTGDTALDHDLFFTQIGGTVNGAVPRNALQRLVDVGYPEVGGGNAAKHKDDSYYAVPVNKLAIQQAILAFGEVGCSVDWPHSWFRPVNDVLPAPDYIAGGHWLICDGWNATGFEWVNSWGLWAGDGRVTVPFGYLAEVREVWKTVDHIDPAPPTTTYRLHIAAGAKVISYRLVGGCLTDQQTKVWGSRASSAGCGPATKKPGCIRGSAIVAPVTGGTFKGRYVRIGTGVTVTHS